MLDFDTTNPLNLEEETEMIKKRDDALRMSEHILADAGLEGRAGETAGAAIAKALKDSRRTLIRIPTGPTESRYAGGPDALDMQTVDGEVKKIEGLVSLATLSKEELIESLGTELGELLPKLPQLEKATGAINRQMESYKGVCDGFDFAGDALKPIRAKLYLANMIHGKDTGKLIIEKALQDFDLDIPLDDDFFLAFSGALKM